MIKNLLTNLKKKKGFTLIELIIVIAIIAIIAAFAIPNFIRVQNNSKIDADVNLGRSIAHEVEILITEGTITPAASTDIDTLTLDNSTGTPQDDEEPAKRIENDLKDGTLKLQTKDAGDTIKISFDEHEKIIITDGTDDEDQLYPTPSGKYNKNQ
ncbi:prepilin-type N-terminal cleavage/methylation domain-containing protein [Clostridium kluyveri]|uniref:prepilin-type N-terminal cleavage/methylation domain-containing protein n=1 Tax=Clostridium kluyveri TaxID=1534 RepID=UPI0022458B0D|nr:prepilin-type N-terminal cleavage/methylation domain-containing protein [Clostridium kluyveri]UZQ50787.1 prepilin-type N-terminal cleavage/methylation domain-containing protein [Clostridium kluyveri]